MAERDVYGTEAQEARAFATTYPTITVNNTDGRTVFYAVNNTDEPRELLQLGWYEVCPNGCVIHWTRKADVMREIGAITVVDALR